MDLTEIRSLFAEMVIAGVVEVELGAGEGRVRVVRQLTRSASASPPAPSSLAHEEARQPPASPDPTGASQMITSPLAGTVVEILVGPGSAIRPGRPFCVLEAAGVASEIEAEGHGRVAAVLVEEGQSVEAGAPLIRVHSIEYRRSPD